MSSFSDMLTYLRKREGLSQQELAERVGLTRSRIGMYETAKREPDFETLELFADFFNVNMDTLMGKATASSPYPFFAQDNKEPTPVSESGAMENIVKLAGRDGSYMEKRVSDEQLALFQSILDQMKPVDDESI